MGRRRDIRTLQERFDANVEPGLPPWACWPWLGPVDRNGYGVIASKSAYRKYTARRLGYELYVRPFPQDRIKCHVLLTCDTVNCVNPGHMRLSRGRIKGRQGGVGVQAAGAFGVNAQECLEKNTDRLPAWVCWPWKGSRQAMAVARRVAYEASTGPVTSGLRVQMTCGCVDCVNPAHARLVARSGAANTAVLSDALQGALKHFAHPPHFRVTARELKARIGLKPMEQRQAFKAVADELGLKSKHTSLGEFYYWGEWAQSSGAYQRSRRSRWGEVTDAGSG